MKVGDKVIAPMQYGYSPVHGVIEEIWTNEYGVVMAKVNYGGKYCRRIRIVALKSLKEDIK